MLGVGDANREAETEDYEEGTNRPLRGQRAGSYMSHAVT
jgi:hypothetical protein